MHSLTHSFTHNECQTIYNKWYCSQSNSKYLQWNTVLFLSGQPSYSLAASFTVESVNTEKNTGFEAYTTIATVNGILLFTHVAHCSLGLRITDNGGMSKTRFSGMYSHADKVRRQVDRSNTWTFKSFILWRERKRERKKDGTGVKPLTTAVILFCVVSK